MILFPVALMIVMLVAVTSTSYHAYKAAMTNPADNLKHE